MRADDDFTEFARAEGHRLRQTAYLLCHDWHLAQDLTQTTLARMFVRWQRIARDGTPRAYSRTVLLRVFLDHRRRRSSHEVVRDELPETPAGSDRTDLRLTLIGALARLEPRDRAIVVLRYWEDLSVDTVADALGLSADTVRSRSMRSLTRLRDLLGTDRLQLIEADI
jgi:RNA polymerase sigma-70 factor (sigma-E family)